MHHACHAVLVGGLLSAALCGQSGTFQVRSPLGRYFRSLPDEKGIVAAAEKNLAADPGNVKLILKLSQALAALWQEKEVSPFARAVWQSIPDNADLLTERGHRELPLREFARARRDLARAVALDPKQTEAYYHLGLAYYFLGEFGPAAEAFCKGRDLVTSQDSIVNFTNWCYVAIRRAGHQEEAAKVLEKVPAGMQSNPGHTEFYFNLVRFYQGRKTEAEILPPEPRHPGDVEAELAFDTIAYEIGNWHLYNGDPANARTYFERVAKGAVWVTWGFIGSETELARLK